MSTTTFPQWRREFERNERCTLTADELMVAACAWAAASARAEAQPRPAPIPAKSMILISDSWYEEAPEKGHGASGCKGCAFRGTRLCDSVAVPAREVFGDSCGPRRVIYKKVSTARDDG